jgi:hypothetical protein
MEDGEDALEGMVMAFVAYGSLCLMSALFYGLWSLLPMTQWQRATFVALCMGYTGVGTMLLVEVTR